MLEGASDVLIIMSRLVLSFTGELVSVVTAVRAGVLLVEYLVSISTHSLFDIVVILRREGATWLSVVLSCWNMILLLNDLRILVHALHVLGNDIVLAHH